MRLRGGYRTGRKRQELHFAVQRSGLMFPVPVQNQVLCKDEFPRTVDGPPDESDHQNLQPGALQQLHLVMEGQLQEA